MKANSHFMQRKPIHKKVTADIKNFSSKLGLPFTEIPNDILIHFRAPEIPLNIASENKRHKRKAKLDGMADKNNVLNKLISMPDSHNMLNYNKFYKIAKEIKAHSENLKESIKNWNPKKDPNAFGEKDKTIFVGQLSYNVDERTLERFFKIYGKIENLRIVRDPNGKSRGYGFIEFKDKDDAKVAYDKAHNREIDNRKIIVDYERGKSDSKFLPTKFGGRSGKKRKFPSSYEKELKQIYEMHPELKPDDMLAFKPDFADKKAQVPSIKAKGQSKTSLIVSNSDHEFLMLNQKRSLSQGPSSVNQSTTTFIKEEDLEVGEIEE